MIEEEVKEAVALGLPVLSPVEVQEQLFRAVLRCGHFNLVKKYMSGRHYSLARALAGLITYAQRSTMLLLAEHALVGSIKFSVGLTYT